MQRGGIYEWELLEALLGACLVIQFTRHAPVILFLDNQAAQAALISGVGSPTLQPKYERPSGPSHPRLVSTCG